MYVLHLDVFVTMSFYAYPGVKSIRARRCKVILHYNGWNIYALGAVQFILVAISNTNGEINAYFKYTKVNYYHNRFSHVFAK